MKQSIIKLQRKQMNESNSKKKQKKYEIKHKRKQHLTTNTTSNLSLSPMLKGKNQHDLETWSKTKINLYNNQHNYS